MILYGLRNCDTCRKAEKALREAGYDPRLVDVRAEGLPAPVLRAALQAFGEDLVNRRSTTWRGLDEQARAADPAAMLAEHPALMKRPLIEHQGTLYLGWSKTVQATLVG